MVLSELLNLGVEIMTPNSALRYENFPVLAPTSIILNTFRQEEEGI